MLDPIPPMPEPAPSRGPRPIARVLGRFAMVCAGLSLAFLLAHVASLGNMARAAARLRGSETLTSEQLLVRTTDFAYREIRNPTYAELPPLVRFYYRFNPMHPGPSDVLRWGSDYRGGCGSHTRVVVAMLQASGVKARPLFLLDPQGNPVHTVVQAFVDGRWVVADALFGIVYRTRTGRLATAADLAADPEHYWAQTRGRGYYDPRYEYRHVALMNWNKIPFVLPAIRMATNALAGHEAVAEFARPSIWMWPRAMMSLGFALVAGACAFGALWSARRS